VDVSLTISPIVDAQGRVVGASKIARDMTQRKLAEVALVKSEKLAAAGRLAAILAHEINNPLQAVMNLISLVTVSSRLGPQDQEYVARAEEELKRIAHLTRQSLSFYRESAFPAMVDVQDTVVGVLDIFAKRAEAKQITIKTRFLSGKTQISSFDGEIRQVMTTLLLNAIDASPENGIITIHVHKSLHWNPRKSRGIRITIADNGVGISPPNRSRVFEPFFTTKGEQGTGLGLWVADGIISRLGGSIQMRTSVRPGESGTCFSIFLPLQISTKV